MDLFFPTIKFMIQIHVKMEIVMFVTRNLFGLEDRRLSELLEFWNSII